MFGSATLAIVASSACIAVAIMTMVEINPRWRTAGADELGLKARASCQVDNACNGQPLAPNRPSGVIHGGRTGHKRPQSRRASR